ncbi:MAG: hypothetical protein JF564_07580, partial [Sphingomonas sp.]|nr:hypothetical protein [Sphingomonas sp.]
MTRILFGDYLPDQPPHLSQGVATADGVIATANGYAPFRGFAPARNGTLAARCIGAGGYRHADAPWLFAATTSNIYTYSSSGYASLASGLNGSRDLGMRFCPCGTFMLATNG